MSLVEESLHLYINGNGNSGFVNISDRASCFMVLARLGGLVYSSDLSWADVFSKY